MPRWLERRLKRGAKRAIKSRADIKDKDKYKTVEEARSAYVAQGMHDAGYPYGKHKRP